MQESEVETLTGTAIYTFSTGLDGEYRDNVRADKRIDRAVKQEGAFRGHIINAESVARPAMIWSQAGTKSIPTTRLLEPGVGMLFGSSEKDMRIVTLHHSHNSQIPK
ncbi:MAG: hypothetical protein GY845_31290 [Planctomycetes bacterium]|nr:hypothetical protein [Planctomycetota bacterium]